jgi:hypothetical protein
MARREVASSRTMRCRPYFRARDDDDSLVQIDVGDGELERFPDAHPGDRQQPGQGL